MYSEQIKAEEIKSVTGDERLLSATSRRRQIRNQSKRARYHFVLVQLLSAGVVEGEGHARRRRLYESVATEAVYVRPEEL